MLSAAGETHTQHIASVINLDHLQHTFRPRFHHPDRRMIVYRDTREPRSR